MDLNNIFTQAGLSTGFIATILIIYKAINGKRCRSHCCGRQLEMDLKIDDIPPSPNNNILINNPMSLSENKK